MSRPISSESVYQAIAHATRRRVLELLRRHDQTASALASQFAHSRPTMSTHLRILQHAGLITQKREGKHRVYSLKLGSLTLAASWLNSFTSRSEHSR